MAEDMRRVGVYGVAGILVAVLIVASFVVGGSQFPSIRLPIFASNMGALVVKLTDAPVDLEHLNVTISSVSALRVEHDGETWEELAFVNGVSEFYVDILKLQNVTRDLSITEIPAGNYTKLRMTVTQANATYSSGETVDLIVPPGHIDVIVHFEVKAGQTTRVIVDMQADWVAISQSRRLRPVLKATVDAGE